MSELFATGRIADPILILLAAEGLFLFFYWRATRRGLAPGDFLLTLVSGFFLVLAVRQALAGGWWGWTGLLLAAGGLAHAADLRRRWRS
jgi:hypothetical protein